MASREKIGGSMRTTRREGSRIPARSETFNQGTVPRQGHYYENVVGQFRGSRKGRERGASNYTQCHHLPRSYGPPGESEYRTQTYMPYGSPHKVQENSQEYDWGSVRREKVSPGRSAQAIKVVTTTVTSSLGHSQVAQYLTPLNNQELVNLGLRCGLRYPTLKKMDPDSLLNDMVHAWLRRDDDVIEGSGEPSWESLIDALEECGHTGIASDIREHEGKEEGEEDQVRSKRGTSQENLFVPAYHTVEYSPMQFLSVRPGLETSYNSGNEDTDDDDPYIDCMRLRLNTVSNSPVVKRHNLMDPHGSYHGGITGEEAEQRLKMCSDHCYLTRYSEAKQSYILTIYKKKFKLTTKHFQISFEHSGSKKVYKIAGKTEEFSGIKEMLSYYENSQIDPDFKTIGRPITEEEFEEVKLSAEQKKRQELEEAMQAVKEQNQRVLSKAKQDADRRLKEALQAAEMDKEMQLREAERQKQQELKAAEHRRREEVARAKHGCIIL